MLRDSDHAVDTARPPAVGAAPPSRYRHLLTDVMARAYPDTRGSLSAVVVPTSRGWDRPRSGVAFAASLAREQGCPLVLLCSREALGRTLERTLAELGRHPDGRTEILAIDVAEVLQHSPHLRAATTFEVDELAVSKIAGPSSPGGKWRWRTNDVGRKRNLALLLARAMRWPNLLFVDDDIWPAAPARRPTLDGVSLRRALDALDHHGVVGWTAVDYPDNSVVGRIRGLDQEEPEQFIGGGALLVSVGEATPFFPAVYNEDWLFFLRVLEQAPHRTLGYAGNVRQDPYDGFDPGRALDEELGDVLGEGLLLAAGGDVHDTRLREVPFWDHVMGEREETVGHLHDLYHGRADPVADRIVEALGAVLTLHKELTRRHVDITVQLASYMDLWIADGKAWSRRMAHADECRPEDLLTGGGVLEPRDLTAFVARHKG